MSNSDCIDNTWTLRKLGELIEHQKGYPFKSSDYQIIGHPIVRVTNFTDRSIDMSECNYLEPLKVQNYKLVSLKYGDIVIATVGSWLTNPSSVVGKVIRVPKIANAALLNQNAVILRSLLETDQGYLFYRLKNNDFQSYIIYTAQGSANQASITLKAIFDFKFHLPPLAEQKAIAHILGTLDDKIELNQQMNQTLEAIAKAIFKSWFVDFDPVRAKMEGRQPVGMDAATAELFPDSFEESALGLIPRGWRVVQLPEIIQVNPTRSLSKGQIAPYLDMKNMPTQGHRPDNWINRPFGSGTKFINGDTLIARITPCLENGKTAFVDFLENGQVGWGSTEYIIFRPKPPLPLEFAYYLARSEDLKVFAIQNMTGSSGRQRTPSDCFWNYLIALPSKEVAIEFEKIVKSLMTKITSNSKQSHTLSITRDILLPKLISGEIRVKEAEKLLDAVV
jgi:type I restriction enzyme S subunit